MNTAVRHPMAALGRIGIVAGLHVAALYLIAAGLGVAPLELPEVMDGQVIQDKLVADDPPPLPDPTFTRHEIEIPPLDPLAFDRDPPPTEGPTGVVRDTPVIPDAVPVPQPQLVGVRQDSRYPLTQPPYPMSEVRAGNEGFAEIEVYVLPTGRVGDARVVKSTGFPALDQSALDEARRRWRLLPATRDGEPYAQWHRLRVVFKLQNR